MVLKISWTEPEDHNKTGDLDAHCNLPLRLHPGGATIFILYDGIPLHSLVGESGHEIGSMEYPTIVRDLEGFETNCVAIYGLILPSYMGSWGHGFLKPTLVFGTVSRPQPFKD